MAFEAGGSRLVYLLGACVLAMNVLAFRVNKSHFEFELGKATVSLQK